MNGLSPTPTLTLVVDSNAKGLVELTAALTALKGSVGGVSNLFAEEAAASRTHARELQVIELNHQNAMEELAAKGAASQLSWLQKTQNRSAIMTASYREKERQALEKDQSTLWNTLLAEQESGQAKLAAAAEAGRMLMLTEERKTYQERAAAAEAGRMLMLTEERKMAQDHQANLVKRAEQDIAYGQMELSRQIKLRKEIAAVQTHSNLGASYAAANYAPAAINDVRSIRDMEIALAASKLAANGASSAVSGLSTNLVTASGSAAAMNTHMRDMHSLARGLAGPLNALWLTWGNILPLLAGAALSSAVKSVVDNGKELEYHLTFVTALTNGATISAGQFGKAMEGSMLSTAEGAKGLRALAQSGLDAQQSLIALPDILRLATVGEMSVSEAALGATGVMHAFNLETTDLARVGDVFAKSAAISNTSVSSMVASMRQASVVGDLYHVTLEEMSASLAVLAKRNIIGTSAGTAMKNMISEMVAPTEKAAKTIKALGLNFYDSNNELKTYTQMLEELKSKIDGLNEKGKIVALSAMFGERGVKGASGILADMELYKSTLDDLKGKSQGFASSVTDMLSGSVEGQIRHTANAMSLAFDESFGRTRDGWSNVVSKLTETVSSKGFEDFLTFVSNGVIALTKLIEDHGGKLALLVVTVGTLSKAYTAATVAIAAETAALAAGTAAAEAFAVGSATLSAGLAAIAWPVAIVTALGAAFYYLASGTDAAAEAEERRKNNSKQLGESLEAETLRIRDQTKELNKQILEGKTEAQAHIQNQKDKLKASLDASKAYRDSKVAEFSRPEYAGDFTGAIGIKNANDAYAEAKKAYDENLRGLNKSAQANVELELATSIKKAEKGIDQLEARLQDLAKAGNKRASGLLSDFREAYAQAKEAHNAIGMVEATDEFQKKSAGIGNNFVKPDDKADAKAIRAREQILAAYERQDKQVYDADVAQARSLEQLGLSAAKALFDKKEINLEQYQNIAKGYITALSNQEEDASKTLEDNRANHARATGETVIQINAKTADAKRKSDIEAFTRQSNQAISLAQLQASLQAEAELKKLNSGNSGTLAKLSARAGTSLENNARAFDHRFDNVADGAVFKAGTEAAKEFQAEIDKSLGALAAAQEKFKDLGMSDRDIAENPQVKLIKDHIDAVEALKAKYVEWAEVQAAAQEKVKATWQEGATKAVKDYEKSVGDSAQITYNSMTKAIKGTEDVLVNFVKTGKMDFKSLASSIIEDLIRIQIREQMTRVFSSGLGMLASAFGGMLGNGVSESGTGPMLPGIASANGNAFNNGSLTAFASGGAFTNKVVNSPTTFPLGLMGEAGPEAIMPLARDSSGKLGVRSSGVASGGSPITNIVQITVQGGDDASKTGDVISEKVIQTMKNIADGQIANSRRLGGALNQVSN